MTDIRSALLTLLADEPAWVPRPLDARSHGRRRRHLRAGGVALSVVAAGSVLGGTLLVATPDEVRVDARPDWQFAASSAEQPRGSAASRAAAQAVQDRLPTAWAVELRPNGEGQGAGFEGTVDDGSGKSRVSGASNVGSVRVGSVMQHPCSDDEFAAGARCTEHTLSDGTRLVLRDVAATGPHGLRTVVAMIVHPNGTGTMLEADNGWFPHQKELESGTRVTPEQKRTMSTPEVTRPEPALTIGQLGELVRAVDAAVRRETS